MLANGRSRVVKTCYLTRPRQCRFRPTCASPIGGYMSLLNALFGVVLSQAVPLASPDCSPLDPYEMTLRVDGVMEARTETAIRDRVVSVFEYWDLRCAAAREAPSPAVVTELARLLSRTESRIAAATMLAEVGSNLRYARGAIIIALNDERRLNREVRRMKLALLPSGYGTTATSLRCILKKSRTGRKDPRLCRFTPAPA